MYICNIFCLLLLFSLHHQWRDFKMIDIITVFIVFLVTFALIDLKYKEIPSVFLTGVLIILLVTKLTNLNLVILSLMFSILYYEFDFLKGLADIKVMTMLGFFMNNFSQVIIMSFLVLFYGIVYTYLYKTKIDKKSNEIPFIPVFVFVFLTMLVLQNI